MLANRVRIGSSGLKSPKTWAEVQQAVRAGDAGKYFDIGDELVSLYDGREIIWQVIGIDVDTPTDSNFTHSMTIQTKDCVEERAAHTSSDNRYINTTIRTYLNNSFLSNLDPELSAVIGQVNKKVAVSNAIGGQDSFSDKVFLLSRKEIDLSDEGVITGEFIYPFYNGKGDANRVKYLDGSLAEWWLRSPNVSNSRALRVVGRNGIASGSSNSNNLYGVSPACAII